MGWGTLGRLYLGKIPNNFARAPCLAILAPTKPVHIAMSFPQSYVNRIYPYVQGLMEQGTPFDKYRVEVKEHRSLDSTNEARTGRAISSQTSIRFEGLHVGDPITYVEFFAGDRSVSNGLSMFGDEQIALTAAK